MHIFVLLLEPQAVDKAQNEDKFMPEVNPSTSKEIDSFDDDTLRGEEI